jgi:hypothetical protein
MKFLKDKRAESFVGLLLAVIVIFTLLATFITMFPLFITKTKVDTMAAQLTRVIELTGAAGTEYQTELTELRASTGLDPDIQIDPIQEYYQLRERFSVTVTVNADVTIFAPASGDPLVITIPITKTITGRSEVYFKP